MYLLNKFIQYFNIIKALPFVLLFYIYINIGYYYYNKTNNDKIRVKYTDLFMNNFIYAIYLGINNQIVYLNNTKIKLEKISIINSNHYHSNDIFIFFDLFRKNKIKGSNICSISTINKIGELDKKILKMEDAIIVNNTANDIKNINDNFIKLYKKKNNIALITFFEGISKKYSKTVSNELKHLLDPKILGFQICTKNLKSKYMYDMNIIYTHNNKLIDPKRNDFTLLLFHPETKIYVELYKYELPLYEDSTDWIKELYIKKDKQIEKIMNEYNIRS